MKDRKDQKPKNTREKIWVNCSRNIADTVTDVVSIIPIFDAEGRFIPYCDFSKHYGVPRNPEVCLERGCKHYKRLSLNGNAGE